MRNSACLVLLIAIFVVILVDEVAEASPAPIFLTKLSRFISDYGYGGGYYPRYYGGGSYGNSYGSGYGNSYGSYNRPSQDRQARGRSYTDICKVFGRPGIDTGSASGTFCPYSG